jgi:polysaccharide export outer membrane protein
MWKQEKGTVAVNSDSIPLSPEEDYRLSVDDKITFNLTTNNGAILIEDMSGLRESSLRVSRVIEYVIRRDSTAGVVELPKIGKVNVLGMTVEECEDTLEVLYSKEYQEPFIQVQVTNQRVIVFPGNGSDAKVIPLINTNTTLMEAIAQAGGITERGKANTVKLMRKVIGKREVYVMDLSVIEGLKYADMIVQANDYIYIEPTPDLSKEFAEDVVPIVSLLSSALLIFTVIISL